MTDIPMTDTSMVDSILTMAKQPKPAAIAAQALSFGYPDQPEVLCGITLTIQEGDRVGIIGHNGCGKTTLFMLLCGVLSPAAGAILLFGDLLQPGQFRPEVGLLFQNPDDQLFSASVRDDIAFGPQRTGGPGRRHDRHYPPARSPAPPPLGGRKANGGDRRPARHDPIDHPL